MRLIDADALKKKGRMNGHCLRPLVTEFHMCVSIHDIDEAPTVDAEPVVHCHECTVKKAVPHKDGMIWRCPHRTHDVQPNGFCESGVR